MALQAGDKGLLRKSSVIVLIAANVLPVFGIFFLNWSSFCFVLLYWFETVAIGITSILKILFRSTIVKDRTEGCRTRHITGRKRAWIKIGHVLTAMLFFVHFSGFCLAAYLVVHLYAKGEQFADGKFPDYLQKALFEQKLIYAVVGILCSHLYSFMKNYIIGGERRYCFAIPELMLAPYDRIGIMLLCGLGGALLVGLISESLAAKGGLILIVMAKTGADVLAHLRERKRFSAARQAT